MSCDRACACAILWVAVWVGGLQAAMPASDHQGSGAYSNWGPGTNGGTGWGGGWTFRDAGNTILTSTSSDRGWFVANSTHNNGSAGDTNADGDINSSETAKAWGLYANSGNQIFAVRPFNGALSVGQTIRFDLDNGSIDSGGLVGVRLLSDASNVASREFELRFVGGDTHYTIIAGQSQTTGTPFTREGLRVAFTLTSPTEWSVMIRRLVDGATEIRSGSLVNGQPIVGMALRNQYAGSGSSRDGFLNNIAIENETIDFLPDALEASINTILPVTVALTPGSNATRAISVTVSSDDATIAEPADGEDGIVTLLFAAGAPSSQTLEIHAGRFGNTELRTTNDGGLGDAVLPVRVVNRDWLQVVVDPYEGVDWSGYQRHKANVHTHTNLSDGVMGPAQVIDEYHARGYDVLALTDHNLCTWPWTNYSRDPAALGMLAIPGNELSNHHHLTCLFVPFVTSSGDVDLSLTQVGQAGGLSVLCHPGRYSYSVQDYVNWYRTYPHLVAMEVINQGGRFNGSFSPVWPGNDIHLWDLVLSQTMPDRPVWGAAADDMHDISQLGRDWLTYLVPPAAMSSNLDAYAGLGDRSWLKGLEIQQPDQAAVRAAMEWGQYFFSTVATHPTETRSVAQTPLIQSMVVDSEAGTIAIEAISGGQAVPAGDYRWISRGAQIHVGPTLNYRTTPQVGNYVRAEIRGQGGTTYTNPFGVAMVGPTLMLSPSTISRSVSMGSALSADAFTVTNTGPETLAYTIASDAAWLTVAPEAGESSGESDPIEITYALSQLPAGVHSATITVSSAEALNSPRMLAVTVEIRTVKPDLDRDGDVDLSDFGLLQPCLGLAAGTAGCESADFNGVGALINRLDVNVLIGCLSGEGILAAAGCDE